MSPLPPLECLRFFDAAARHQSFVRAAKELQVTASAVAYRVRMFERHLGSPLFDRSRRGVALNDRGKACFSDVHRILAEVGEIVGRYSDETSPRILKLVAVEAMAEMWLMPRLPTFRCAHPSIAVEFETDHYDVDPGRRNFDLWVAFADKVQHSVRSEVLFEETLVPVCSPAFLASHGTPAQPADLHSLPLLYDLAWHDFWAWWFSSRGVGAPNLSEACGFRLYSMMIQAAVKAMGVALGHTLLIEPELRKGTLVTLFGPPVSAPYRYFLATGPGSGDKPEVHAFRAWLLQNAHDDLAGAAPVAG